MAAQYLSTSRLANVIQLITLGRQTGILRVIRGHGATREMGQIQFAEGQPTAALLGSLTGGAAMNVISNWGETYYAFEEAVPADGGRQESDQGRFPGAPSASWPSGETSWSNEPFSPAVGTNTSLGSMPGGTWPAYGYQTPVPPQPRPPVAPAAPVPGYGATGGLPGLSDSQPGMSGSYPGVSGSYPGVSGSYPSSSQPAFPAVALGSPAAPPRRTTRSDISEPLPLDRRERMILLLVDGRRGSSDLARLTRRSEDEVQAVLTNLRMLGLVE